jgi:predicted transcriptional regulator
MRDARNEDGKTYYVPADMTYRDWEKPKIHNSDGERNTENKLNGRLIMINF